MKENLFFFEESINKVLISILDDYKNATLMHGSTVDDLKLCLRRSGRLEGLKVLSYYSNENHINTKKHNEKI
jgi:hypothetical protein